MAYIPFLAVLGVFFTKHDIIWKFIMTSISIKRKLNFNMKKILFWFMVLHFNFSLLAQSVTELDNRNGFKDIHLGDAYSKWSKNLIFHKDGEKGEKLYFLNPSKLSDYSVFDKETDAILIYFRADSIRRITIETDYFQKPKKESGKYTDINIDEVKPTLAYLTEVFGKSGYAGEGDMKINELFMFAWKGEKVILKVGYINGPEQGSFLRIDLFSVFHLEKDIRSGF